MIDNLDPGWMWLIGGVLLLILEVIAPGFFLVFLGAAAMATGMFTLLFGFGIAAQLALFALYAVIAVLVGRRFYANRTADSSRSAVKRPRRTARRKSSGGGRSGRRPRRPRPSWRQRVERARRARRPPASASGSPASTAIA